MKASDKLAEGQAAGRATAPLFGRDRELAELDAALAQAGAGRGRLFLLAGEPGIGKTCLAEAVAERGGAGGMLPLWGRSWESGGAPAYWPWVQILRSLIDARSWEGLQTRFGGATRWLAEILPELRELLSDLPPPQSPGSEQARFVLFDSIASFLRSASDDEPLVVVLDDLHTADQASLLLFEFVAEGIARSRILLLGTYQQAATHRRPEVERLIGVLRRHASTIVLGGVGETDLGQIIERHTGKAWPDKLVRALHETTEGNPFFTNEVVRLLAAGGRGQPSPEAQARFPLPDTVREAIDRRFEPLGPRAIEVLQAAAVIGRDFRVTTLERAMQAEPGELIDPVDEAASAGLVAEVPGSIGRFRFTHNLVRETLYMGLSGAARVRLHLAVGEALESMHGAAPERLAELAHHFAEAAPGGNVGKALDYAIKAGHESMRVFAYEQAAELYELAVELSELLPPETARRAELLLALGRARGRAPDMDARDTLVAAAEAARPLEDPRLFVEAGLEMWVFPLGYGVLDSQPSELLSEALGRLPEGDDARRACVLARLALSLYYWPGTEERRSALAEEALSIAHRLDDPGTLAYVLGNAQLATAGPDNSERDLAWMGELLTLTEQVEDDWLPLHARNQQIDLLLELDDLPAAGVTLRALELLASESSNLRAGAYAKLHRGRHALIEGDYAEAARLNADAAAEGARLRDMAFVTLARAQAFQLCWDQGRLDELVDEIRAATSRDATPAWPAGLALTCCEIGRSAEAKQQFERLAVHDFADLPRYNGWLITMALLSEVCVHLGDARRAEKLYELLTPFAARNVVVGQSVFAGPVVRYLGILASVRDDWALATSHFEAAREAASRMNSPPVELRVNIDEALMLAKRDEPGDRDRALQLLADGAALAQELGVERIGERIERLQSALADGGRRQAPVVKPPVATPASLRREGDVWTFELGERSVRVRDGKGVRCIAVLLTSPGVEIHALELAGERVERDAETEARSLAARDELAIGDAGDAGPLLDSEAKEAYRRRLEELREEVDEAESFNDPERAANAREEIDFIASELAGAVGLGGRDRKAASSAERARVSVTKAVRATIRRLSKHDPVLGRELETTVRTGTFCVYEPDPRHPLVWQVDAR